MGKHMGFLVQFKWSIYKVMTQNVTYLNLKLPHWDSGDNDSICYRELLY